MPNHSFPNLRLLASGIMSTFRLHQIASQLLGQIRASMDLATRALAHRCVLNGKLDTATLDAQQIPSFELAWASAELLAAENALATAAAGGVGELDNTLFLVFAAETISLVRSRLELINVELDLPELRIDHDSAWRELRAVLSTATLQRAVALWAHNPSDLGDIRLADEHALVRDQFMRFGTGIVTPLSEKIHRRNLTLPEDELLQPLREMGVFGLSIPEVYGGSASGSGEDNVTMIVVTEALSQASLGAAGSLITRPEILARALLTGGTARQKADWLPRIAAGDPLCAIAITEPDHGSDVANLTMRATRAQGGWRLNGAKTWCTFAGKAGVLMVVARTAVDQSLGHRGLSLVLVEKPSYDGHEFEYRQESGGVLAGRGLPTIGF